MALGRCCGTLARPKMTFDYDESTAKELGVSISRQDYAFGEPGNRSILSMQSLQSVFLKLGM